MAMNNRLAISGEMYAKVRLDPFLSKHHDEMASAGDAVKNLASKMCASCVDCPHRLVTTSKHNDPAEFSTLMIVSARCTATDHPNQMTCPDGFNFRAGGWPGDSIEPRVVKDLATSGRSILVHNEFLSEHPTAPEEFNHDTQRERAARIRELRLEAMKIPGAAKFSPDGTITTVSPTTGNLIKISTTGIEVFGEHDTQPRVTVGMLTTELPTVPSVGAHTASTFKEQYQVTEPSFALSADVPTTTDAGSW